jgi:hypothetical protein
MDLKYVFIYKKKQLIFTNLIDIDCINKQWKFIYFFDFDFDFRMSITDRRIIRLECLIVADASEDGYFTVYLREEYIKY